MSAQRGGQSTLVHSLATLLRNNGDSVLDGSSTLTLQVACVQHLTRLFEQYLLSRTHQHGFLALPSHPADTTSLLQVQFLFDMLQKTVSLKLVHPPGPRLQSVVKIFPFKSLKHLELKRIPPHCLEGLRGVYSQLEVFICSKSLNTLEELLSLCGGDLSSALPWLELHTLNFSYNSISCLDESLSLLNVLRSLDLSHNNIKDCAEFLKPLSELEHLNLSYNNLQRAPVLSFNARARLTTLVLRNNELETINGVEYLSSLQHFDLAYNLLMAHSQLAPLSFLHNLHTLTLEGNPLFYQKMHRTSTVCHLSPRAAFHGTAFTLFFNGQDHQRTTTEQLKLDGFALSSSELMVLPKAGQSMGQISQAHKVAVASEQAVQDMSSGGGELSDSLSVSESGASRVSRRKSKNKVKVRTASISEPSDTDHEPRSASLDIILHHQKDIERMDSFREQMGEDWLRFQHHIDGTPAPVADPIVEKVTAQVISENSCTPSPLVIKKDCLLPRIDFLPAPLLSSELKREEEESMDLQPETESTLQWTGHSPASTESTLETSVGDPPPQPSTEPEPAEEEEEDHGVDLCRPMLVGMLSENEEPDGRKGSEPFFLRVNQTNILEVDMHQGRAKSRLELESLRQVTASQATVKAKEKETSHPVLELHFNYISQERRKRRYIMLDDDPQEALQALVEVLSRVIEDNERQAVEGKTATVQLQCLKCQAEFPRPLSKSLMRTLSELDDYRGHQEVTEKEHNADDVVFCPECSSDHVVQLPGQTTPSTSTPVPCGFGPNGDRCFTFDDVDTPVRPLLDEPHGSTRNGTESSDVSTMQEQGTDSFLTAHSSLSNNTSNHSETWPDHVISYQSADSQEHSELGGSKDELAETYSGSQGLQNHSSQHAQAYDHGLLDLLPEDVEAVDHRLKLFLDVEVFDGEEEIHSFLKMSVVKFGDPLEFPALMVVSDQRIYILKMTSCSEGQPSDWLEKRESHRLCDLSYLEVGLGSQSIHMEFDEGAAAYTLLVRDSTRCNRFFGRLTGIAKELAPKADSKLKGISTTRLNPKHHLWPLVCEGSKTDAEEDSHPPFFYLLAFLQLGDAPTSVTVLATQETLCLLDEDHQWSKSCPNLTVNEEGETSSGRVTVRETQPISCVSSVHLFSSDPCQVDIKLYDEMAKEEKTWPLKAEAEQEIQGLVDWIKSQWEAMFGVKLITVIR